LETEPTRNNAEEFVSELVRKDELLKPNAKPQTGYIDNLIC